MMLHPNQELEPPANPARFNGATTTVLLDDIAWAPEGPMLSAVYGDGHTQTRGYDQSYRMTSLADSDGTTALRDQTLGYELRDNLASVTDLLVPANTEAFGYTPRESLSTASGIFGSLGYSYDGVGNRLTEVSGAVTDSYSYPVGSNRLQSVALGGGGSRDFTHDASGNVLTDSRSGILHAYTYDSAGRLAALSVGGSPSATYVYDAMGRQAIRTLLGSGVTIHSVFDSQGRRIAEYNEATGALIREYVWLDWDPIAVVEGGVVYLVRADHIGRPAFATDVSGTVVWSASYLPFGGVAVSSGALPDMRFPGQWYQAENGLYQNWMRDYDPTTGRYLQADPLGLVDGASVYGYALQNPGRYVDPRGECVGPWAIACAAAAGAAVNVALGYLIDELIGDGCYTWQEAGFDAAVGAVFGPWGRAWGIADDIWRYGRYSDDAARASAAAAAPQVGTHGHHPIPKVIGGATKQPLVRLRPDVHREYHRQLNEAFKSAFGQPMTGRAGSRAAWAEYFKTHPGSHRSALDELVRVSKEFDASYGTSIAEGVAVSRTSGAYKFYP